MKSLIMANVYGSLPEVVCRIPMNPKEMMFWLYCPIKLKGQSEYTIPDNLRQFHSILSMVKEHESSENFLDSYVYLTVKSMYVTPENPGNRPGWHSDGFGTEDINYIWYDCNPTEFWEGSLKLPESHVRSMEVMEQVCRGSFVTYEPYNLLRLDQRSIHRVNTTYRGFRCFIKVSLSKHLYNLVGNSINHQLPLEVVYNTRSEIRNCPQGT